MVPWAHMSTQRKRHLGTMDRSTAAMYVVQAMQSNNGLGGLGLHIRTATDHNGQTKVGLYIMAKLTSITAT